MLGCRQWFGGFDCALARPWAVVLHSVLRALIEDVVPCIYMSNDAGLTEREEAIVSCLFLVGACSVVCSLGWGGVVHLLLSAIWLVLVMLLWCCWDDSALFCPAWSSASFVSTISQTVERS